MRMMFGRSTSVSVYLQSVVRRSCPKIVLRRVGIISEFDLKSNKLRPELAFDLGVLGVSVNIVDLERIGVEVIRLPRWRIHGPESSRLIEWIVVKLCEVDETCGR